MKNQKIQKPIEKKQFLSSQCWTIIMTSIIWLAIYSFILIYYIRECEVKRAKKAENDRFPNQNQKYLLYTELPAYSENDPIPVQYSMEVDPKAGEMGTGVVTPPEKEELRAKLFPLNQFNILASDMIPLNRSLPEFRTVDCQSKTYPDDLPTTSVVIVFHNEAWSTLLRTIWSVINRSPRNLLEEIILVDDASEREFLGEPLDEYVMTLPVPTFVIRMYQRSGLVRSRLKGVSGARGATVTFLDAHCECSNGWLQPLLYEIYKNRTSVPAPFIDIITDNEFRYVPIPDQLGCFQWKMNFDWFPVPKREYDRRAHDLTIPYRTPTMAGGLFAIDRNYFYEIGSYDEGMSIWGGENIEMSLRIWMCGGEVLTCPCSHVGHVYRVISPYSFPAGAVATVQRNQRRTAEVWLDEYKEFYYKINPIAMTVEYGNVSSRIELRKKLQCKSFKWYIENIYPESQFPVEYYSLGRIRNINHGLCLDTMGRNINEQIVVGNCFNAAENQMISYTKKKHLAMDDWSCITFDLASRTIKRVHNLNVDEIQMRWTFNPQTNTIMNDYGNTCLEIGQQGKDFIPILVECGTSENQAWLIEGLDLEKYGNEQFKITKDNSEL